MKQIFKKNITVPIRIKESKLSEKIAFISLGLSSTIWLLVRVIPKPSRVAYPCMRASAPIMSAFVLYLISLFGGVTAWMKAKTFIKNRKYFYATLFYSNRINFHMNIYWKQQKPTIHLRKLYVIRIKIVSN